jgi:radical SAM protein with 4Fe4S-binding SPASM domain
VTPERHEPRPLFCVWEITLACNARCAHCGSDAGRPREGELSTGEALDVVDQLARLGCRSVTLSGGEPLLRRDWPRIAGAVRDAGMRVELISNGLLAAEQADDIARAGFYGVNFSVDGDREAHDALRGVRGALDRLLEAASALAARGVRLGAVTQVNRRNLRLLPAIRRLLRDQGILGWQLQLTMPHGRAARLEEPLCLAPEDLPALEATILGLKAEGDDPSVQVADNIGYMSRKEPALRSDPGRPGRFWTGCQAGLGVVGISSDGKVRGCLSLPSSFDEGSLRDRPLADIWHDEAAFPYTRRFDRSQLEGPCAGCPFGAVCRGGCTSMAVATTGNPMANAHCLFRLGLGRGER